MNCIPQKDEISIGTNYILQLNNSLGGGTYGEIYKGRNIILNIDIAIKCESLQSKHQRLKYESGVLKYLQGGKYPPPIGIPALYDFLTSENFNYMMMELLGPSLEDLFDIFHNKFSLKTILSLGDQMICRIEYLHSMHLIHRDIKPDNFLIGLLKNKSRIYICDFGLCKKFIDQNGKHIPFQEGKSLTGTSRYASINSHLGYEQSRRDDLESLAYSLIYFSRGSLPWMGTKAQNKQEKYKKILQMKLNSKVNVLCDKLPKEFIDFVNHIKNLAFDDKPNYQYLKSILGIIYEKYNFNYDTIFDFTDYLTQKEKEEKEKEKEKEKGNSNKTQTDLNIFPRLNRNKKEEEKNNEKDHKEKKDINTNNKNEH